MKKAFSLLTFFAAMVSMISAAQALPTQPSSALSADRFSQCISNASCSLQTRFQILQEESARMDLSFQKIHRICADRDFDDCLNGRSAEMQVYLDASTRAQEIMHSLQALEMNNKISAAGDR